MKKTQHVLVEKAVKGMLPKNKLGAELFRNLYVVEGAEHDHGGQQPNRTVNINEFKLIWKPFTKLVVVKQPVAHVFTSLKVKVKLR